MQTSRRSFLTRACLGTGALAAWSRADLDVQAAAAPDDLVKAPSMHLGLVTYNLAEKWDLPTIIRNCEAARFEGVELRTTHAHGVEVEMPKARRAEVKKMFRDSKVRLMGLGSIFDYHTPDQEKLRKDMEATQEYIILAEDVGATGIKVRPNALPKEVPREKTLEQIGRSLGALGDFARDHGQVIRLEVHGSGTALVPHIKTILEVANHKSVGACWNSNQSDLEGEGWEANFNRLKDRINAVHMRDLFLQEYPWRKLLTGLNEIGFTGFCLAEIPASADPVRVMRYYRALWLAYQGLV
jgi:sugar phosphate isomerase/epimerase